MRSTTVFLTLLSGLVLAGSQAAAQSVRVQVGELTTPDGVRSFDHRLDVAAQRFCGQRYQLVDLAGRAACLRSLHEEALAQLTSAEQKAYAEARRPRVNLTAADR